MTKEEKEDRDEMNTLEYRELQARCREMAANFLVQYPNGLPEEEEGYVAPSS